MVTMTDQRDALLQRAFDSAPTSLSLSDVHGRLVAANRAFWELFGHEPGTELTVAQLSRTVDQEWTSSYLRQLVDGDIDNFQSVKRFVRADGSEFDASLTIRAIRHGPVSTSGERSSDATDDGEVLGMIATVEPMSSRPRVDGVRVGKFLEHAAGTLTLIDVDGAVLETSGRYRATLGYPPEFWERRTIFDVLVPEDAARVLAMRDDVVSEPNREVTGDFRVVAADQRIETLEVTATNLLHDPDVEGIVITSRNVTEERANTRAVSRLRDEAVAEVERRTNVLATVSHELRNPLHAMAGMAELLASDDDLTSAQHELAAALQRQLLHLTDVTDDLLDSARLDVGQFRLRPESIDVRRIVDDVVMWATSTAGERLDVRSEVDDDVPSALVADPTRLRQVIGNLVGNAVKFTETGSVDLVVGRRDDDLTIVVTDTGPGIPPEDQDEVFQAFATLAAGGDRRGAGLGLAIVHRLVEAMDGVISLDSEVGVGTRFTVSLPLVEDDTLPLAGSDAVRSSPRGTRRILVIEDTPVNQDLARAQLDRLGMECVIAESAERGLDLLRDDVFDAVLMDHQLPGMNGRDATREIRARGSTVPIIGITASSTAADEQACYEAGMNAFLPKPVGLEPLSAALDTVMAPLDDDRPELSHAADDAAGRDPASVPTPADAGDPAGVDHDTLDRLVDELDDRSIVEQLVRSFLAELDVRIADIAGDDAELAVRQAHTLKSSAALLGAHELARRCATAELDPSMREGISELAVVARTSLLGWIGEDAS